VAGRFGGWQAPAQVIAKANSSERPTAASASPTPLWIRQPTNSPVAISTPMPSTWVSRSDSVRPASTADRAMGSDRNLSISPLAMSVVIPTAVPGALPAIAIPNMPLIRYWW
jgi:hypothetical protein